MEGVLLDPEVHSIVSALGALVVLAFVAAGTLLGSISERERSGERFHWTAEPIPGTEEAAPREEFGIPKAA